MKPPEYRLVHRYEIRLTEAQRQALDRLGGAEWIRDQIDGTVTASTATPQPLDVVLHCPSCGTLAGVKIYGKSSPQP